MQSGRTATSRPGANLLFPGILPENVNLPILHTSKGRRRVKASAAFVMLHETEDVWT